MYKNIFKRFLALFISLVILLSNLIYADSVVIGVAPGLTDGRTMSANTNTTYLQNLYTGPGTAPNSSITGLTPIQGVNKTFTDTNTTTTVADSNLPTYTNTNVSASSYPYSNVSTNVNTNNNAYAYNNNPYAYNNMYTYNNNAYAYNTNGVNTNPYAYNNYNNAYVYNNASSNAYAYNNTANAYAYNNTSSNLSTGTYNSVDAGPTVTSISSPASNIQKLENGIVNVGVITNNALTNNGRVVTGTTTDDRGPTTSDPITSPTAHGGLITDSSTGPAFDNTFTGETLPSYETSEADQTRVQTDLIQYRTNDYIQAVKPSISAEVAIVVNATTRQIYYSKGGLTLCPPASLANLVTASILIANRRIDDVLTVSQTAVSNLEAGANVAGLQAGDVITVRDAIGALFVASCCDVANVVAENIAGSVTNFVNLMNQTVKTWGCVSTNFTNPSGLNNEAQKTTSYDMAIIMDKASSNVMLKVMMLQPKYTLPATAHRGAKVLNNKNYLVIVGNKYFYTGVSASRMGYTSKAKYTMATTLDYNGQKFIAVVLRADGTQWTDTTRLLNFAKVASLEASAQTGQYYTTTFNTGAGAATQGVSIPQANAAAAATINATSTASTGNDTAGTWMQDGSGWYFMKSNGQRANNEWIKQGTKYYCIDSTGYMVKGWRQMSNGNTYYFDPNSGEMRYNTWINVSTGAYYLQEDGSLAKAEPGQRRNITTAVGTYTIDDNGKAIAKV